MCVNTGMWGDLLRVGAAVPLVMNSAQRVQLRGTHIDLPVVLHARVA